MRNTGPAARYTLAIFAAIAALFVRDLLTPLLGTHNPYYTVWLAVVFSAWYCGLGPSIVTSLLGALGVWYWFLPPPHSIQDRSDAYGLLGFLVFSSAIIALGESNRRGFAARSRLAAIVESSDDAIISKNLDGVITSWNGGAERMFGYSAEEAIGQNITLIVPAERRDEEATTLERLKRGEEIEHFETVRMSKDGTELDISLTISPVKDAVGGIVGASKVARDVSGRKRAEQALRQSEARLAVEAAALARLNDWSSRLWSIRSLEEGLDEMLAAVIELLGADKGNIQLLDAERGVLTIALQRGFDQEFLDFFREVSADDDSACGRALRLRQPIVIEDVEADVAFAPFRSAARAARFRSVVSAPLIRTDGAPMGMLSTHFASVHRPTDRDLRRLDLYVRQAAGFVERCKTEEALRQSEERFRVLAEQLDSRVRARTNELEERNADVMRQSEQLRELSTRLLQTQDAERRHIARELHDSAGQIVAALGMNLAGIAQHATENPLLLKAIQEGRELVQELSKEIRTTSYLLHPPLLDENGLSEAIRWYIQGLTERSDLSIELNISENFGRLPNEMELAVFRIVQESLTNIHRHSGSKTATIRIVRDEENVSLEIQDNGSGIPAEKLAEIQTQRSGVGMTGMRERVRHLKGVMKVESNDRGTKISVTFPVLSEDTSRTESTLQQMGTVA